MKQSSILIAVLVAFGLGACGEQQKPAAKAPETKIAKPEAAAPAPPPAPAAEAPKPEAAATTAAAPAPAAPAGEMKKEEKKDEKK